MFQIEFVAVRDRSQPEVLEKTTFKAVRLVDADKTAKSLLEKVRQKRRATPPDGYQIRAHDGRVVLRYLEHWRPAVGPEERDALSKQPRKAKELARSISGSPPQASPPGNKPSAAPTERHIETPASAKGFEIFPPRTRSEKKPRR